MTPLPLLHPERRRIASQARAVVRAVEPISHDPRDPARMLHNALCELADHVETGNLPQPAEGVG